MSSFGGSAGWPSCYPATVSSQWFSVDAPYSEESAVQALEDAYKAKIDAAAKLYNDFVPIGKTESDASAAVSGGIEEDGALGAEDVDPVRSDGANDSEGADAESSRGGDDEEMYESSDQGMESLDYDQ